MRIGIVHCSLDPAGGAERLCLTTIEALKEAGHKVVLATVEPTDWTRVERIVGSVVRPNEEVSLFNFKIRMFGIYMRLLTYFLASRLRRECDILLNTHGDVLPIRADIVYMHYPTFALLEENPANIKYSKSLFWKAYFIPYKQIQESLVKRILGGLILTNSSFSKKAVKKHTGKDAVVVYPPVEVEKFSTAAESTERGNIVVSCGRYTPEKNYEFALRIAENLREKVRSIVIGASSARASRGYYQKLSKIKGEKNLENLELLRDMGFKELLEIYGKSKIYLHAMSGEHFGISVVEAMSAGLVPVVHRSGGPWEDILKGQQGKYGFSYSTLDEATEIIEKLIENEDVRKEIVVRNLRYVRTFSAESFKKDILSKIESLCGRKGRS